MTRLIVDTDTAGDDVTSLLIALLHPNAQLEAITICNGNVDFDQQVENALYTVEQAGQERARLPGLPEAARRRLGRRRVRARPGRHGRLVLPEGDAAPRARARGRRARPPDQRVARRADAPRAGAADEHRDRRRPRPVDRAEGEGPLHHGRRRRQHHAGRRVQLLRRPRGREDRLQGRASRSRSSRGR